MVTVDSNGSSHYHHCHSINRFRWPWMTHSSWAAVIAAWKVGWPDIRRVSAAAFIWGEWLSMNSWWFSIKYENFTFVSPSAFWSTQTFRHDVFCLYQVVWLIIFKAGDEPQRAAKAFKSTESSLRAGLASAAAHPWLYLSWFTGKVPGHLCTMIGYGCLSK